MQWWRHQKKEHKDTGPVTVIQLKSFQNNPNPTLRKRPVLLSNQPGKPMHLNYNKGLDFPAFSERQDKAGKYRKYTYITYTIQIYSTPLYTKTKWQGIDLMPITVDPTSIEKTYYGHGITLLRGTEQSHRYITQSPATKLQRQLHEWPIDLHSRHSREF